MGLGELGMKKIPITRIFTGKEEVAMASSAIRSGWVTQGPMVARFEGLIEKYTGAKYAVAVSSGTTALHIALLLSGVGPGDEVITTSLSFIATANSIIHAGALPVFVDISPLTYNISAANIRKFITCECTWSAKSKILKNKNTGRTIKAIMPVDQVGLPAELDEINDIAKQYRLAIVEDAACALGSKYKNRSVGSVSPVTCFSFHPRKVITTGEGGAITTDNEAYASKARRLRSHGLGTDARCAELGYNYRLSDIHAAVGIAQMKRLSGILSARRRLARRYNDAFRHSRLVAIPYEPAYAKANFQSYILRLKNNFPISRDSFIRELSKKNIYLKKGITASHEEPYYKKLIGNLDLPATEEASASTVLLPLYPGLTFKEQETIIKAVKCYE